MEQLKRILASLSMRQRISILVAMLAVGGGLAALVQWRKESDFKPLFTGLAPEDTAAVMQKLKESSTEYRIGEGPPPLFLVVCFFFIVLWAMFSWIPFFGY